MNLRSGLTLRRDSRNHEEFNERKLYQKEQRLIEDSLYDESEEDKLEKKIKNVFRKTKHLLYLNKCQQENNSSLTDKINTIMELFEVFRYNTDYMIEYFNKKGDKRFPQSIFDKGQELCYQIGSLVRTRKEKILFEKCKDDIYFVMYLMDSYILKNPN